ncbi:DUF494 domain-containing protein [Marinicella rhabdoformis]|uniref:DUF494 domain-containing protein n=1 Tax=Marinicella rhabdoformis TaxID=2580566 RepID=UPI0012AEC976|nr:DUF494 domain-containing protein [Marinicella rhabdoformis]
MNENIIDVLVYLFENYMSEHVNLKEQNTLNHIYHGLEEAGFAKPTIDEAFDWLTALGENQAQLKPQSNDAIRIYQGLESEKLDDECIDFITYLEGSGILTPHTRELLINSLLHLNADNIDVDDLQWLALIILFTQPEQEQAFASMESLMFDPPVDHEH